MGHDARKPVFGVCKQRHRSACISQVFYLVSEVEETSLSIALSEIRKTGFVVLRPNMNGERERGR